MCIVIASEAGGSFNHTFRTSAAQQQNFVFDALTRLHARACQIAYEILTLLKAGYADGAHARWRTLHEISVIGYFIAEAGQDTAEAYLLHTVVESYKASQLYQDYSTQLGYEPLPQQELDQTTLAYEAALNRFGRSYAGEYGWASQALRSRGINEAHFRSIEKAVNLSHWRPYYKMASHNVHANPKGILFKLGSRSENRQVLLAGPSDTGFTDPAHSTAISLHHITVALLTFEPTIDQLVVVSILQTLIDEIGEAFLAIQKSPKFHDEL